ncbi:hypothetical protein HUB98_28660 [Paenibacillus barcinonensis]|uniref:Uncharacterized protein n=1 Tax=Paenibacillus barcinonensis TaxID=198119 RepID=A0A2V4WPT6_PAEBA|nr:hypothetical protein [Paenibacillus barcinonensis]PYE50043.1 hypothetical protein DFQ00_1041 [Paenibacillus barcinonensis]QKS59787.1 hypothetical protein HUB98_28660 [Paenibacillus barcinonensis]
MFNFFRKKSKETKISLENQIEALKDIGISFTTDDDGVVKELLHHFDRETYEDDFYSLLLSMIGSDLVDENDNEVRLSKDVWSFDTECVENEEIYSSIINELVSLTRGKLQIQQVKSHVDFDNEDAKVSFILDDQKYEWEIHFEDDWIDFNLLRKIGELAIRSDKENYFIYFNDGQNLTILYTSKVKHKSINDLIKDRFSKLA